MSDSNIARLRRATEGNGSWGNIDLWLRDCVLELDSRLKEIESAAPPAPPVAPITMFGDPATVCREGHQPIAYNSILQECPACDYRKRLDEMAKAAPPVATTGAVPSEVRDAIKRIWEHHNPCFVVTSYEPNSKGRRARLDDFDTVGSWLSAAPAPKASEGEERRLGQALRRVRELRGLTMGDTAKALGLSVSAVSAMELDQEPVSAEMFDHYLETGSRQVLNAQPHARAEGASREVHEAWQRVWSNALATINQCESRGFKCEQDRADLLTVAKALALSGSAEGNENA